MKKSILKLGKTLSNKELKSITGSATCPTPQTESECDAVGGYWFYFNGGKCLHRIDYCY